MSGVFAVSRDVFDHPMFAPEPFTEREAWIWLVGAAAWKKTRVRIGKALVDLDRGQLAFSTRFIAVKWKWAEARVRRFLNRLKTDAMIVVRSTRQVTHITICNYDEYQFQRRTDDAQIDAPTDAVATHKRRKEEEDNKGIREEECSALRAAPAPNVPRETKRRAKARAPLPEQWSLSEVERAHAKSLGFAEAQIASMASAFENHHRAKGSLMADWSAAWRTWVGNEIKFSRSNGNGYGGSRPLQNAGYGDPDKSVTAASDRLIEKLRAFDDPAPSDLRGGEGQASLRLISKG